MSRAIRLTRAFEQLSLDYRVTLQTFDSLLHTLQAAWSVGPSHTLTETWRNYRQDFDNLHLRARTNASRLAVSLEAHHKQLCAERLSDSRKRARLNALQEAVRTGKSQARQIKHDYDILTAKVEAFPVLMNRDISSWTFVWSKVNSLCLTLKKKLTSLWDRSFTGLVSFVRRIVTAICKVFGYSAQNRLPEDYTEPNEKSRALLEQIHLDDALEIVGDDCGIICDRTRGFEACWAGLYVAMDTLEQRVKGSKGMVGTNDDMTSAIREVYTPVIKGLTEFARGSG